MPLIVMNGERLRQLRLRRGLSQVELAAQADVLRETLQRAEHGRPIMLSTARKICEALGVRQRSQLIAGVVDTPGGFGRRAEAPPR